MNDMLKTMLGKKLQNMDEGQMRDAIEHVIAEQVAPELIKIRERAENSPSGQAVRGDLTTLNAEQKQALYNEQIKELVEIAFLFRKDPQNAVSNFKSMLRDPHTMESLLLIFDNPKHIDEDYADEMKDAVTTYARWIGVGIAPEMYSEAEIEAVADQLNRDIERVE